MRMKCMAFELVIMRKQTTFWFAVVARNVNCVNNNQLGNEPIFRHVFNFSSITIKAELCKCCLRLLPLMIAIDNNNLALFYHVRQLSYGIFCLAKLSKLIKRPSVTLQNPLLYVTL